MKGNTTRINQSYLDVRSIHDVDEIRASEHAHEKQLQRQLKKYGIKFDLSNIQPHGQRIHSN